MTVLKDEISNSNSNHKDEINNLKDTVIKRLQEENQNLQQKCNKLEAKIVLKKKKFMAPFYRWGSTASRLKPL